MEDIFAPIDEEINSFKRYFSKNGRCILSAPFGEGKSFFLNQFIMSQVDEYDFITIYPTNYQICDNRDILEYIKRDILFGLIALDETIIDRFDVNKLGILRKAILESKDSLVECIPDINASVCGIEVAFSPSNVVNTLLKIWESCEKLSADHGNPYKEYLKSFNKEKGGIYELDAVTNLICSLVKERKESQENARKTVLVVEDLDRIDPAHIFRILNVLSAHMTYTNDYDDGAKNKFNFDKILLLCDFKNIEKIYHHLYGEKTDFKGYISKFSAVRPFEYSIRDKIVKHVGCLINRYVKESIVSNVLAEEIVSKTVIDGNVLDNIRNIKERIVFAADQFIVTQITVEVQKEHLTYTNLWDQAEKTLDKLYVTTDKPLMAFLSISKAFSVSAGDVLRKVYDMPRGYADANHIEELCGLLMIPILPTLRPILDYKMKYRLGRTEGYELVLSSDGEILGMSHEVYEKNPFNYVGMDDILKNISFFDEYLF